MAESGGGAWGDTTEGLVRGWEPTGASRSAPDPLMTVAHTAESGAPPPGRGWAAGTIGRSRGGRGPAAGPGDATAPQTRGGGALAPTITRAGPAVPTGLEEPDRPAAFPEPGDEIAGFRLLSDLGRGAFARVYLAEQAALANRPVALKVSRAFGDEYRALARLQHTHIVPIHSVHDDPATGLRLLCMPYLGGANLAQVLEAAGVQLPAQATGGSLVEALDEVSAKLGTAMAPSRCPASVPSGRGPAVPSCGPHSRARSLWRKHWARPGEEGPPGEAAGAGAAEPGQPARHYLRHASYIQAAVWIAARLAEGLDHAHSRGLVHRDLKPSNVLIAVDGTPMLLDFNLATDSAPDHDGAWAMLGGTLPYMAPEHLDAFNPRGSTPPEAVDERSDLYALGLILFEMVAGRPAFPDPTPGVPLLESLAAMTARRRAGAPSLRAANPLAPWGLDAVLRKCLDPEPGRRYGRAADLAEDLRRFLDDLPLVHVAESSVRERLAKWSRRNPRAVSASNIAALALVLSLGCIGVAGTLAGHLEGAAAQLKLAGFRESFDRCQLLLNTTGGPAGHLEGGAALARQALEDYGVGGRADWTAGPMVRRLPPAQRRALREDVAELALLLARAEVATAGRGAPEAGRRRALGRAIAWLDRAEHADPRPTAALFQDRARYHAALGRPRAAALDRQRADRVAPSTCRDYYLLGTELLAGGAADRAEAPLARAVALDARRFWAWFTLGLCHLEQGRHADAAADFAVCAALAPDFAWPHLNRGLALARQGRLVEAREAYDRALAVNDRFVEAFVNRSLTLLELGDAAGAERDLARAIALGRRDPATLAAHGEAQARLGRRAEAARDFAAALADRPDDPALLVARGFFRLAADPPGAEADFRRAVALEPRHARALLGLALGRKADDPRAALAHADAALAAEPGLGDALQLRALLRARLGDAAALADADRLAEVPTPARLYNAACAVAILAETTADPRLVPRSLALLRRALDAGLPAARALADPDLRPLRDRPEFRALARSR